MGGLIGSALLIALAALLVSPPPALAKPADPKIRSAARQLGIKGIQLFRQGKFEEALEQFNRANELYPAPTLGMRAGRCLEQLGRLVEASDRYLEVTRFELEPGATWVHHDAKKKAQQYRDRLLPTIPKLRIELTGDTGGDITVRVDDEDLPAALVGTDYPIDPGTHTIHARRVDATVTEEITLAKGDSQIVELRLPPRPPPPPPPPPATPEWSDLRIAGVVTMGVGGAGLLVGAIGGFVALGQESSLEDRCPDRVCPPDAHGEADAYDASRTTTTVGFVIGGVGAVAGATLLLIDWGIRDDAPAEDVEQSEPDGGWGVSVWLGTTGGGIRGHF